MDLVGRATIKAEFISKKTTLDTPFADVNLITSEETYAVKKWRRNEKRKYKLDNEMIDLNFYFTNDKLFSVMVGNEFSQKVIEKHLIERNREI